MEMFILLVKVLVPIYVPIIGWLIWRDRYNSSRIDTLMVELSKSERARSILELAIEKLAVWIKSFQREAVEVAETSYNTNTPVTREQIELLKCNNDWRRIIKDKEEAEK